MFKKLSMNHGFFGSFYKLVDGPSGFQPENTRNILELKQVGLLLTACTPWGTVGPLSRKVIERTYFRIWACALDLGEDVKKWGFAVGRSAARKTRYLSTFHLRVGLVDPGRSCNCWRIRSHSYLLEERRGIVIFVAWTMFIFCWCADVIMEWDRFVLIYCGHEAALSGAAVLWKCPHSAEEHHGPAWVSGQLLATPRPGWYTRPAAGCQGLLFSLSRFIFCDILCDFSSMVWRQESSILAPPWTCVAWDKSDSFPETQFW